MSTSKTHSLKWSCLAYYFLMSTTDSELFSRINTYVFASFNHSGFIKQKPKWFKFKKWGLLNYPFFSPQTLICPTSVYCSPQYILSPKPDRPCHWWPHYTEKSSTEISACLTVAFFRVSAIASHLHYLPLVMVVLIVCYLLGLGKSTQVLGLRMKYSSAALLMLVWYSFLCGCSRESGVSTLGLRSPRYVGSMWMKICRK